MQQQYLNRRLLRTLENIWSRGESVVNRFATARVNENKPRDILNPFYHLGTLSIFLLAVLTITGLYLTVLYRPGVPGAYTSVVEISANWFGALMRSIHRYASDAMALVILLHAIKTFVSDRFWGQRWIAWITGWVLIFLLWSIGSSGYWLVWDERAQWITEFGINLAQGATALSFVTPEGIANLFAFFVLVLFVHVFFSIVIMLGLLLHLMRMARVNIWSPRWLMVETLIVLIAISIWQPAMSLPIANLDNLVGALNLDGWFLSFLPFSSQFGAIFWIGIAVVGIILMAMPWLYPGKHQGPAFITDSFCSGCALCARECPYNAIQMKSRTDNNRFQTIAVIDPAMCTGCGICVGTCASAGVELTDLRTAEMRDSIRAALQKNPLSVVVFACQRHIAMGTFAHVLRRTASEKSIAPVPFFATTWGARDQLQVITQVVPCVGMVMPEWMKEFLDVGARAVINLSCAAHDCSFREGPFWLHDRIKRHPSLFAQNVYTIDPSFGDAPALNDLLDRIAAEKIQPTAITTSKPSRAMMLRAAPAGLALLLIAFIVAMVIQIPGAANPTGQGMLRLTVSHKGIVKLSAANAALQAKLPPGMTTEQVLGGERYPVQLRLVIDNGAPIERQFAPGGLSKDGAIFGVDAMMIAPGQHQVELWMNDDGKDFRKVFSGVIQVDPGRVRTLAYDPVQSTFIAR